MNVFFQSWRVYLAHTYRLNKDKKEGGDFESNGMPLSYSQHTTFSKRHRILEKGAARTNEQERPTKTRSTPSCLSLQGA